MFYYQLSRSMFHETGRACQIFQILSNKPPFAKDGCDGTSGVAVGQVSYDQNPQMDGLVQSIQC